MTGEVSQKGNSHNPWEWNNGSLGDDINKRENEEFEKVYRLKVLARVWGLC